MFQLLKLCIVIQVMNRSVNYKNVHHGIFFSARSPEELSFEEGEILYVTDDVKYKDWYLATTNKNRTGGLIPRNYGKIFFALSIRLCYAVIFQSKKVRKNLSMLYMMQLNVEILNFYNNHLRTK